MPAVFFKISRVLQFCSSNFLPLQGMQLLGCKERHERSVAVGVWNVWCRLVSQCQEVEEEEAPAAPQPGSRLPKPQVREMQYPVDVRYST